MTAIRRLVPVLAASLAVTQAAHATSPSASPACPARSRPLLILPLGDSLTSGVPVDGKPDGGYRTELYRLLKAGGCVFHFVGSEINGPDDLPEKNNEGHGGFRIDEIAAVTDAALQKFQPDMVLLGAGGNDELQGLRLKSAPQRLLSLVRRIAARSPHALVLVQTRPIRTDGLQPANEKFNASVRRLIDREHRRTPSIWLVDNARRVSKADLLPDGRHPTPKGNEKLAQGWYEAIVRALRRQRPTA